MITINELRIGNIFSYNGENIKIENIYEKHKLNSDDEDIINIKVSCGCEQTPEIEGIGLSKLIPLYLTEELLLKSKFIKTSICIMSDIAREWHENKIEGSSMDDCFQIGEYYIVPRLGMSVITKIINNSITTDTATIIEHVNYLHELQNIMFFLTKKELEINI